ncbi:transglycosylase SLT domain-containing protein [Nocardia sp. NPDC127526]|uniref:transglycosylase SLT domain-containing protein n=1 Tax=Nocardia sp. NPDC127526 TaxID=3345393 RepID=UPI003625D84B
MSLIAGHVKIAVGADMTDFLNEVRRNLRGDSAADRERENDTKKRSAKEGDTAGKSRAKAENDRLNAERDRNFASNFGRLQRMSEAEGDLLARSFARAWAKGFEDEVRKTTGKGLDIKRLLADDLKLKEGKAANSAKVAKKRAAARRDVQDDEFFDNEARRALSREARTQHFNRERQKRDAEKQQKQTQAKADRDRDAKDTRDRTAEAKRRIVDSLKPAGRQAVADLRGYAAKAKEQIASVGKLTETAEIRGTAWQKLGAAHEKAVRDTHNAYRSMKRSEQAVDRAATALAAAQVQASKLGDDSKVAPAETALESAKQTHKANLKRYAQARALQVQSRRDADTARKDFVNAVKLSNRDKQQLEDAKREVRDAARAAIGLTPIEGDRNKELLKTEGRVKNLRTKNNGRERRLSPNDHIVIRQTTQAAAALDALQVEANEIKARAEAADARIDKASQTMVDVDDDATASTTRRTAAERELKSAILDRDKIEVAASRNRTRLAAAKNNYNIASGALTQRENSNPFIRFTERLEGGTGNWLDNVNDRLIYAGRYLSSITQIATTAGAALAAMGAVNLLPLISSAAQAASALATLPAIITAAGAGIAALAVGGSGIIGTFKAAKDAGESAADVAEQQEDAAERVADAYDSMNDARENADRTSVSGARQIASAEKSVQSALERTKTAQENLNKARENAADKIRDLNDALKDNSLDERSAALAAIKAGQNVIKTAADPNASWIDIAQAQIDAEQAQFDLEETQKNNQKEVTAAAKANEAGIEGDEDVIAARKALTDANESLAESQQRLTEVAESVAQANADANKRAERAARDYQNALEDQKELLEKLGTSGLGEQYEKLYKKLSPNAQGLVDDIRALGPEWTKLRKTSQDALTNGLGKAITDLARKDLPVLSAGLAAINTEINSGIKNSLKVFSEPKSVNDFNTFLSNTAGMFRGLGNAATPLTRIFVDLTTAGSATLPSLGNAINDAANRWANKIDLKRQTGELNLSINNGIAKMQELGTIVGNTFGGVRGFFQALRGEGDSMTARMVESTARFEQWTKSAEGADRIRQVFGQIKETIGDIQRLVGGVAGIFTGLFGDAVQTMGGQTLKVLADVANALATIVNFFMEMPVLGAALNGLMTVLVGFFALRALTGIFKNLGQTIRGFGQSAADASAQAKGLADTDTDSKRKGKKDGDADGDGKRNSALDIATDPDAQSAGDDDKKKKSGTDTNLGDGTQNQSQAAQRERRRAARERSGPLPDRPGTDLPGDSDPKDQSQAAQRERRRAARERTDSLPDRPTADSGTPAATSTAQADIDATRNKANAATAALNAQAAAGQKAVGDQAKAARDATTAHGEAAGKAMRGQVAATGNATREQSEATNKSGREQADAAGKSARSMRRTMASEGGAAARDTAAAAASAATSIKTGLAGILSDFKRVWGEAKTNATTQLDATDREFSRFERNVRTRTGAAGETAGRMFSALPERADSAFRSVGRGLSGIMDTLGGPWTLAFTGAAAAFSFISGQMDAVREQNDQLKESLKEHADYAKTYATEISEALNQSDGLIDDNVRGVQLGLVAAERKNIKARIDGHMSDNERFWADLTPSYWVEDRDEYNARQRGYDEQNRDAYKNMGIAGVLDDYTDVQINNAILGSGAEFNEFLSNLKHIGDSDEAVQNTKDKLTQLRQEFLNSQNAASRLKSVIDTLRDGNLEAADAVSKLAGELSKQQSNANVFQNSRASAYEALRNLQGFTETEGGGQSYVSGPEVNDVTANGAQLLQLIDAQQTATNTFLSGEFNRALNADPTRNVDTAIASTEKALESYLDGVQAAIAAKTGLTVGSDELNALLARYRLDDTTVRAQLTATGNQARGANVAPAGLPAVTDPTVGAPAPANGQPAAPANGEQQGQVNPANGQQVVPPAQAQPQPIDYSGTTKAYNDLVDVVNKLKTAFADTATETGKVVKGLDDTKGATEKAKPKVDELTTAVGALQTKFTEHLGEAGALKAWQSLVTGVDGHVKTLTETILPSLTKAVGDMEAKFSGAPGNITTSFSGVKRAVADPLSWIITTAFAALKTAWNSVRTVLPTLPQWDAELTGITGYWTGGIIPGYTPGRDNRIIAVGGGEAIMRPEFTRAVGSDWVHGMNAAAMSGGIPGVQSQLASAGMGGQWGGAFATGGIVDQMSALVKTRFPMMTMTSGIRNEPGSYHHTGQAADFSNGDDRGTPEMKQLAAWIAANFRSKTAELIHSPFNHNIKDGQYVKPGEVYDTGTLNQHKNHVHWALSQTLDGDILGKALGSLIPDGMWDSLASASSEIQKQLLKPMEDLASQMPNWGGSLIAQIPGKALSTVMDAVKSVVGTAQEDVSGQTAWDISAGVAQWRSKAIAALEREGFGATERNIQLMLAQIQSESGGDPNVKQKVQDVNSGWNDAMGLLQVTPGTFRQFRNPDLPDQITNPDANMSAALRYYRSRYGDDLADQWGQGHGYDSGGWLPHLGWGWNLSGKPEPVFTNDQWQTMIAQLNVLAGSVPGLDGYSTPTGPASFVEMLTKVVAAASKALKKTANLATKDQAKPKQDDPSQSKDTSGAVAPNNGGSGATGKANDTDTDTDTNAGTGDPATVNTDQGLVTGELENGETPTGDNNGDIQPTNPDPDAGAPTLNADGTPVDETGTTENPATETPAETAPAKTADQLAAEAYQKAAETTRDPAHYQAIWSKAGASATKSVWDQFTSDLGITGSGFLSQAYSAANDSDNQLNQVINYELGNRVPGYKEFRQGLANPGAAITSAAQQAATNAQTAVQGAQKVVEEHIHYHVSNIDEAIRKNAIRQQQNAAAYMSR